MSITVADLKKKAKEMKIKNYSKMNKNELEQALGIPKPSAYRSMRLSKLNLIKPSEETESRLKKWKAEMWQNLTAKISDNQILPCGTKGKKQKEMGLPSVCRPTKKIDKTTTSLASNFTIPQIKKAIELKKQGKRIIWKDL
jgi:hypothetical protein